MIDRYILYLYSCLKLTFLRTIAFKSFNIKNRKIERWKWNKTDIK